jgi:protein involved in polysaccharide export with SLBB domain
MNGSGCPSSIVSNRLVPAALSSWLALLTLIVAVTLGPSGALAQTDGPRNNQDTTVPGSGAGSNASNGQQGPVRLRQDDAREREADDGAPRRATSRSRDRDTRARDRRDADGSFDRNATRDFEPPMSEFEVFVQKLVGPNDRVRRFGVDVMSEREDEIPVESNPSVPVDYVLKTGDELQVSIWGSVDGQLRLVVDRSGRITIPRVGAVQVAGVKYGDLEPLLVRRVGQVFRNFELSATLGRLRGVRVYVTGHVARPGSYSVTGLATLTQALMRAGGPSHSGSFRNIQLRRGAQTVSSFDLYDLLLKGDRGADKAVQADDVIHVGPVGREVALIGSVNRAAIFELLPRETLGELLTMAGGYSAVADRSRLAIERLDDRNASRITQLEMPTNQNVNLNSGDVVRAFSAVDAQQPVQRQNKRVRIEGEVVRPGDYVLSAQSTLADALAKAGGLTQAAYPFGAEFSRESVRQTQQQNYERALRDMETEFARYNSGQRTSTVEEAAAAGARANNTSRLIERLRAVKPNGRIVLQLQPEGRELPALALEDGDRIYIPPRPTSVGVFGSVFSGGSYLFGDGRNVDDFLRLAGGPTRGADTDSIFVIRANGGVLSNRGRSGLFSRNATAGLEVQAQPGDTIFVPEEMDKTTFTQHAKDWGQIVSQFGLGLAAIITLTR